MRTNWRTMMRGALGLCLLAFVRIASAGGFSLKPGDFLAANYGGNSVLKIDADSGAVQKLGDFITPTDVALASNGDLFISEWGGSIYRMTLTNGVRTLVNPDTTMSAVWGLVLHPGGDLIATCGADDTIVRVNPATGAETVISASNYLYGVSGIALQDADHVMVCSTFNNQIVKVALASGAQTPVPTVGGGFDMPRGVAMHGSNIYMTAFDSREIRRVPVTGGTITTFFTAGGFPFGMDSDSNGNVVTGTSGTSFEVLRVSPGGILLGTYADPLISEVTGLEISRIGLTVTDLPSTPPVLDWMADMTHAEGSLLNFQATATDADWPPQALTFSLASGAPDGAAISSSGIFGWTPSEVQGPGLYGIDIVVTDNDAPPLSSTNRLMVTVTEMNRPPVLTNIAAQTVDEGDLLEVRIAATDPDWPTQTLAFSLGPAAPLGAFITSDGIFTWEPADSQGPTNWLIVVNVADGGSPPLADSGALSVAVNELYLQCSSSVAGTYKDDVSAVFDKPRGVVVTQTNGQPVCFFRLRCNLRPRITSLRMNGEEVTVEYQNP